MSRDRRERRRLGSVAGLATVCLAAWVFAAPVQAAQSGPLILAQSGDSSVSLAEQKLQEAVEARRAAEFDRARDILTGLERGLTASDPLYREVRDERYFHLPLAEAQQAINSGEVGLAESKIGEAERYLTGHPNRGELSRTLERYQRALWMVK